MKPRRGEATVAIDGPPDRVFATLADHTDWAAGRDERVVVIELDRAERRLAYRSKRDEDNPSFAVWTWLVDSAPGGSAKVTLAWELRPVTFLRKRLFSVIRNRRIARTEAPAALDSLRRRAATSSSSAAGAGST